MGRPVFLFVLSGFMVFFFPALRVVFWVGSSGFSGFFRVLPGLSRVSGFIRVNQGLSGFIWVYLGLSGLSGFIRVEWFSTGFSMFFQCFQGFGVVRGGPVRRLTSPRGSCGAREGVLWGV